MQPPARCSNHRCVYIDQCANSHMRLTEEKSMYKQGISLVQVFDVDCLKRLDLLL